MKAADLILGLFFSDENSIVYDNIKVSQGMAENLTESAHNQLRMISLRFLGPLFLTAKIEKGKEWKFELLEAALSQHQERTIDVDLLQSFFSVNSSIEFEDGITNLFAIIGSPYTEDVKIIHDLLTNYLHPSMIQGKVVNESLKGGDLNFDKFINNELKRGVNVINYFLGSARKMYWEELQKYYCVGFMERITAIDAHFTNKVSNLYTFDFDDELKTMALKYIPSFYVMAILPDYYENRISETLNLLNPKISVYPVVRLIRLSSGENHVIYLEEHSTEDKIKRSFGVILISENESVKEANNLAYYKKQLRLILDKNKNMEKTMIEINSRLNPFDKWNTLTDEGLDLIKKKLDIIW
ncbi:MAG: hypothetical protein EU532_11880 [Promethearchaeota archaeon]|nr:MAG: hypothetical protein EU532_11880 [Candidatus Lokiarchaeota archaeon]